MASAEAEISDIDHAVRCHGHRGVVGKKQLQLAGGVGADLIFLYSGSFSLRGARAFPRCTKAPGVTAMTRAASAGRDEAAKPGAARIRLRQQDAAQKKRRWINIHASAKEKSVEHVRFEGRNGNNPTLFRVSHG